jgi:UMF1 family MFS transporter
MAGRLRSSPFVPWVRHATYRPKLYMLTATGSFLPITLEQLARDRGVLLSDKITPCMAAGELPVGNSTAFARPHKHDELPACVVYIGNIEINTASFAMYTFSLSVLVQALLIISMSGAADHGKFRKKFLLTFAFIGAIAMMCFLGITSNLYLLGALLAIIANTCFGASFVLLNSFLPLLVRHHPSVQPPDWDESTYHESVDADFLSAEIPSDGEEDDEHMVTSVSHLLPNDIPDHAQALRPLSAAISLELKVSTNISSMGIGIGYLAGLFVQCLAVGIVVLTGSNTFSLRLVLFVVGLWWFCFSIPAALWLRPRPGPPLASSKSADPNWIGYFTYAWSSLYKTIRQARKLKDIVIFLAAWFLLSDSIATVSGTAVLFAKTQLAMSTEALGLINVIATVAGVLGAFYWSFISRLFNLRASQTIVACICLFEIIPLYGMLGFVPAVQRYGVFGLQQPWEMYPLGAIYGFVLGGLSSYCRSFFGELIPPGFEAAFYALYAITDKGSSIFGPAIVGAITDRYGEIRPAFVFLAVLIALPLPLMMIVDVDRGKADAKRMALELEGKKRGELIGEYTAVPGINMPEADEEEF